MMGNDDRETILRRRTFFVTSALAALSSCARTAPPPDQPSTSVVSIPQSDDDAGAVAVEPPAPDRDAQAATNSPPFDIPNGVSDTARQNYDVLYSAMRDVYRLLDEAEADLPSCNILDAACEPRFARVADKLQEMGERLSRLRICGGSSAEAQTFGERQTAHFSHYQERRSALEAEIQHRTAEGGKAADERWAKAQEAARSAHPTPCLKYGCPDW